MKIDTIEMFKGQLLQVYNSQKQVSVDKNCHVISKAIYYLGRVETDTMPITTVYEQPISLFSLKSRTFALGQTNWADEFWGIWGIFRPNYQHSFWYSESFVHVF